MEKDRLESQARALRCSLSFLVRTEALSYSIRPSIDPTRIAEFRAAMDDLNMNGHRLADWLSSKITITPGECLGQIERELLKAIKAIDSIRFASTPVVNVDDINERTGRIGLRVDDNERDLIEKKSKEFDIPVAAYVLATAVQQRLIPRADKEAFLSLARAYADSGRVRGLLRLWLTEQRKSPSGYAAKIKSVLLTIDKVQVIIEKKMLLKEW